MKRIAFALATVVLFFSTGSALAYESMVGPTGLIRATPEKAFKGYTLIAPSLSTTTFLIDMTGSLVHKWESKHTPALHAELLPTGNLLRTAAIKERPVNIGGAGGRVEEYDWKGKLVWSYELMNENQVQHHTATRMPNGNTLILAWERVTSAQMKAKGRKINFPPAEGIMLRGMQTKDFWVDFIREVNPQGKTVWEWHVMDHIGKGPDKIDINYVMPKEVGLGKDGYDTVDWSHLNTVQYVPGKDIIITNSRNLGELYFIDKKTGKIIYRWGNPTAYGKGKKPSYYDDGDQIMFGSHAVSMLDNGNIIAFDNGSERPQRRRSRILEMDPATNKIVWEYGSEISSSFYTDRQGSVQKLPNGNFLVTSTHQGHIFEVTPEKEVVWEYVSPVFGALKATGKSRILAVSNDDLDNVPKNEMLTNFVHRAYRYGPDYAGFKGKDLSKNLPFMEKMPSWMEFTKKAKEAAYSLETR